MHIESPTVGILEHISAYRQVCIEFHPSLERQGPLDPDQAVLWELHRNLMHNNGLTNNLCSMAQIYRPRMIIVSTKDTLSIVTTPITGTLVSTW